MKKLPQPTTHSSGAISSVLEFIKKHAVVLSVALFACLAGYILILTNQLTAKQPSQSEISSELGSIARPTIDDSVVKTILGLEDRNIEIKAIFQEARDNPFSE